MLDLADDMDQLQFRMDEWDRTMQEEEAMVIPPGGATFTPFARPFHKQLHMHKTHGKTLMTLYHVTKQSAADAIYDNPEHKMQAGSKGYFGGGIYFARSPGSGFSKMARSVRKICRSAGSTCWVIKAEVMVGNQKQFNGAWSASPSAIPSQKWERRKVWRYLDKQGYDSVVGVKPGSMPEYVVYHPNQVRIMSILPCVMTSGANGPECTGPL